MIEKFFINLERVPLLFQQPSVLQRIYQLGLKLSPQSAELWLKRGHALAQLARYDEAVDAYQHAVQYRPDAQAYTSLGAVLFQMKQYERAEESFRQALILGPSNAQPHYYLANMLTKLKRYSEAEQVYGQAFQQFRKDEMAYIQLGAFKQRLGSLDEAEKLYRQGLVLNPHRIVLLNLLIRLLMNQSRDLDAQSFIDQLAHLHPTGAPALLILAFYFKRQGKIKTADLYLSEASVSIQHDDWYDLACLEALRDHRAEALKHLATAASSSDFDQFSLSAEPIFAALRDDPRFAEIVGKANSA